jgi:glycerophosphoryl diester phosphodiesterase
VIDLGRVAGRPLVVGHRGAPAEAPENTLRSFRAAVAAGVDVVEFDVLDLPGGPLVVAHSDHLEEVSHGAAHGRLRGRALADLRAVAPELPTLDDALAFFAEEARDVGLHIDLKLRIRLDELAVAVDRHGLASRTVVSAYHAAQLRDVARASTRVRRAFTYPEDRLGVSRRRRLWPVVAVGLSTLRASVPYRLQRQIRRTGASAVMLQHRLVTEAAVARAHAIGAPILAWTVDDPDEVARVVGAGVDGVITNDPSMVVAMLSA